MEKEMLHFGMINRGYKRQQINEVRNGKSNKVNKSILS